jgi:hypothetical protein
MSRKDMLKQINDKQGKMSQLMDAANGRGASNEETTSD